MDSSNLSYSSNSSDIFGMISGSYSDSYDPDQHLFKVDYTRIRFSGSTFLPYYLNYLDVDNIIRIKSRKWLSIFKKKDFSLDLYYEPWSYNSITVHGPIYVKQENLDLIYKNVRKKIKIPVEIFIGDKLTTVIMKFKPEKIYKQHTIILNQKEYFILVLKSNNLSILLIKKD